MITIPLRTLMVQQLQQALAGIPHEGWDQVVMLDEQQRDVEIEVASV